MIVLHECLMSHPWVCACVCEAADARDDEQQKSKETAVFKLADLYASMGEAVPLAAMLKELRPFFAVIAKAKTAKIGMPHAGCGDARARVCRSRHRTRCTRDHALPPTCCCPLTPSLRSASRN